MRPDEAGKVLRFGAPKIQQPDNDGRLSTVETQVSVLNKSVEKIDDRSARTEKSSLRQGLMLAIVVGSLVAVAGWVGTLGRDIIVKNFLVAPSGPTAATEPAPPPAPSEAAEEVSSEELSAARQSIEALDGVLAEPPPAPSEATVVPEGKPGTDGIFHVEAVFGTE